MNTENQSTASTEVNFEDLSKGFSFAPPEDVEDKKEDVPEFTLPLLSEEVKEVIEEEVLPITEEKKEEVLELKVENTFYTDLIRKKIEKGLWEDALVKDGETEVKISEFENATEEDYLQFEEDQKALKDQDLKEKYLNLEKITPERKLILDIVANGGDLKEIFQTPQQLEKPFDEAKGWDLQNEKHQESIVYQHYLSLGNSESRAALLLEADKKEMVLDTTAQQVVDFHQKAYTENLENINKQLVEDKKTEAENIKKYNQELLKIYKEQGVPEVDAKKYATSATKEVDGQFDVDAEIERIMKNPSEAAELIFFVKDREKYKRAQGIQTKVQTQMANLRTVDRIPKTTAEKVKTEEKETTSFSFMPK